MKIVTTKTLTKKAQSGWLWGAIEQFGHRGLSILVSVVLARLLTPESFGLIASVSIFLTTAQQLIDGGIGSRIMQKKSIQESDYLAFFWCNLIVSLLACSSIVILSRHIGKLFGNEQLNSVLVALAAGIFLMNAGRTQELRLIRELKFKLIALVTLGSVAAGSITGLALAFGGFGVWAILGQQLTTSLVRAMSFWIIVPWHPSGAPSWLVVKDLYAFGLPIMISQTLRGFSEQLINVLTARYVGLIPLGFYDRGRFIPNNVAIFVQNIFLRTNLAIMSRLQDDEKEFRNVYLQLMKSVALLCALIMTGLIICAPEIIEIVLGEKWLPSVLFFRASCIMSSIYLFFIINLEILKSKGKVSSIFKQNIAYSILQSIFVTSGLYWGILGMLIGGMISCLLSNIILITTICKTSKITLRDQVSIFLNPAIWGLLTAAVLLGIKQIEVSIWIRFFISGIAGASLLLTSWYFLHNKHQNLTKKTTPKMIDGHFHNEI